jgi:hypothetical protein
MSGIHSTGLGDGQAEIVDDNDLAWGAAAIGAVIRRKPRQVFYLAERGLIPVKKIGRQWVGSRRKLRAYLTAEQDTTA